ncbi:hypothetical protein N7452_009111 [Penicillium brevicompactum]|uniref:Uncharacterized protein n=1 Tax=Penicillium brevicompactum TaxID=5074 RepID=A0A9W9Q7W0_PENBR|nr:hypothetical protein N7452_009111 [Penicillium brevicompactum]
MCRACGPRQLPVNSTILKPERNQRNFLSWYGCQDPPKANKRHTPRLSIISYYTTSQEGKHGLYGMSEAEI